MYFIGFNVPNNCLIDDPIEDSILDAKLSYEGHSDIPSEAQKL